MRNRVQEKILVYPRTLAQLSVHALLSQDSCNIGNFLVQIKQFLHLFSHSVRKDRSFTKAHPSISVAGDPTMPLPP